MSPAKHCPVRSQLTTFSFNSSGATIVPDRNENGLRYPGRSRLSGGSDQHGRVDGLSNHSLKKLPSLVSNSRMLMPEDSFGRQLEAMFNGESGDDSLATGHDWSMVRQASNPSLMTDGTAIESESE